MIVRFNQRNQTSLLADVAVGRKNAQSFRGDAEWNFPGIVDFGRRSESPRVSFKIQNPQPTDNNDHENNIETTANRNRLRSLSRIRSGHAPENEGDKRMRLLLQTRRQLLQEVRRR
jgi:hypothetical protein